MTQLLKYRARIPTSGDLKSASSKCKMAIVAAGAFMAAALALCPDTAALRGEVDSMRAELGGNLRQISQMEATAQRVGSTNVKSIPLLDALYLARYLGASDRNITVGEGFIEFPVPLLIDISESRSGQAPGNDAGEVTAPMIAERIEGARKLLGGDCSVQKIWPELLIRVYTVS